MRLIIYSVLFAIFPLFSGAQITTPKTDCARHKSHLTTTSTSNEFTQNYDVTSYTLKLNVNPDTLFISGTVTIYFTPTEQMNQFIFDLYSTLSVSSINGDSTNFTRQKEQIILHQSFQKNISDSVTITYSGKPPANSTAFVKAYHEEHPILWTLSEPYGASHWWPCKESLTDKADSATLQFTVPKGNKVASNGVLVSTTHSLSTTTFTWKTNYPTTTYLFAFAATNYAEIKQNHIYDSGQMLLLDYVYPEDSIAAVQDLLRTDSLLHLYDSLLLPYPFLNEKYGHAQFSRGGGMEHQTMSFMTHFRYPLMAHELAHQWFGNYITCATWGDLWLNEGFATYFTGVPMEFQPEFGDWQEWKASRVAHIISEPAGSVYVTDTLDQERLFDARLTYSKGAYVLHTVRKQIGDSAFFNGIKAYVNDSVLAYGNATTDKLFDHLQQFTPIDLTALKTEWVYGEGYPNYNLNWQQQNNIVQIELQQQTSHSSVPFFHLNVPVLLHGKSNQKLVHLNQQQGQTFFEIAADFDVENIVIDPDLDLVIGAKNVLNTSNVVQFSLYPNPAQNTITVQPGTTQFNIEKYQIYDITGKLILQDIPTAIQSSFTINLSELAQGQYNLILIGNTQIQQQAFTITR